MQQTTSKNLVAQIISQRFIDAIKSGTCPWQKPWKSFNPSNALTKKEYSGINFILLSLFASDNLFLTYNQAKQMKGTVKKGAKGFPVVYYQRKERKEPDANGNTHYFLLRYFTVFQVSDCDLPNFERPKADLDFKPVEEAERIFSFNKCEVETIGSRACYIPSLHRIQMPKKEAFDSVPNYYATLFHEVGHSLMPLEQRNSKSPFGSKDYAKEELVAELFASLAYSHATYWAK